MSGLRLLLLLLLLWRRGLRCELRHLLLEMHGRRVLWRPPVRQLAGLARCAAGWWLMRHWVRPRSGSVRGKARRGDDVTTGSSGSISQGREVTRDGPDGTGWEEEDGGALARWGVRARVYVRCVVRSAAWCASRKAASPRLASLALAARSAVASASARERATERGSASTTRTRGQRQTRTHADYRSAACDVDRALLCASVPPVQISTPFAAARSFFSGVRTVGSEASVAPSATRAAL